MAELSKRRGLYPAHSRENTVKGNSWACAAGLGMVQVALGAICGMAAAGLSFPVVAGGLDVLMVPWTDGSSCDSGQIGADEAGIAAHWAGAGLGIATALRAIVGISQLSRAKAESASLAGIAGAVVERWGDSAIMSGLSGVLCALALLPLMQRTVWAIQYHPLDVVNSACAVSGSLCALLGVLHAVCAAAAAFGACSSRLVIPHASDRTNRATTEAGATRGGLESAALPFGTDLLTHTPIRVQRQGSLTRVDGDDDDDDAPSRRQHTGASVSGQPSSTTPRSTPIAASSNRAVMSRTPTGPAATIPSRQRVCLPGCGWSDLTVSWLSPLFHVGEIRQIQPNHLPELPLQLSASNCALQLDSLSHDSLRSGITHSDAVAASNAAASMFRGGHRVPQQDSTMGLALWAARRARRTDRSNGGGCGRMLEAWCCGVLCSCAARGAVCCGCVPKHRHGDGQLALALWRQFGPDVSYLGWLQLLSTAGIFAGPLILRELLDWTQQRKVDLWPGLAWAVALTLCSAVSAVIGTHSGVEAARLQVRVRSSLVGAVFRASLSHSAAGAAKHGAGAVVNHMSVDPQKLQDSVTSLHQLWALPLQVVITLILLWREVHLAFVAGLLVCVLMIPLNGFVTRRIGALTSDMMTHRDARVGRVSESAKHAVSLKLQLLEPVLAWLIAFSRTPEMAALSARKYLDAICVFLWATTPVLVSLATFGTVVLLEPKAAAPGAASQSGHASAGSAAMSPSSVFVAVSLLAQLIFPMNALPWVLAGMAEAAVSLQRLDRFLFHHRLEALTHEIASVEAGAGLLDSQSRAVGAGGASSSSGGRPNSGGRRWTRSITEGDSARPSRAESSGRRTTRSSWLGGETMDGASDTHDDDLDDEGQLTASAMRTPDKRARRRALVRISGGFTWHSSQEDTIDHTEDDADDHHVAGAAASDGAGKSAISSRDGSSRTDALLTGSGHATAATAATAGGDHASKTARQFRLSLPAGKALSVRAGECIAVVGRVGSGKTALLNALCGRMKPLNAAVSRTSPRHGKSSSHRANEGIRIAWLPQTPWIRRGSIAQNVGCLVATTLPDPQPAFVRAESEAAVEAVALSPDLRAEGRSMNSLVRDGGAGISGGQGKRVALARAIASRAPMIVADSPLDALDGPVGKRVFREVLAPDADSLLSARGVARVLSTHDPWIAVRCARVLAVVDGMLVYDGPPHTLPPALAAASGLDGFTAHMEAAIEEMTAAPQPSPDSANFSSIGGSGGIASARVSRRRGVKDSPELSTASQHSQPAPITPEDDEKDDDDDSRAAGHIESRVCGQYCVAIGWGLVSAILVSLGVMQLSRNGADWWLAQWSSAVAGDADGGTAKAAGPGTEELQANLSHWTAQELLLVLGVIAAINAVSTLARSFCFAWGGLRAAKRIHDGFIKAVLSADIRFWALLPPSHLLNRASRDQYMVDETLPFQANILLAQSAGLLGSLGVIAYATSGWFLVLVPLVGWLYWNLQSRYRASSRELRRIDSSLRTPLYSHFHSCAQGADVIQSAGAGVIAAEAKECDRLVDITARAWLASSLASQWLGLRLQVLGGMVTLFAALFAVLSRLMSLKAALPDQAAANVAGGSISMAAESSGWVSSVAGGAAAGMAGLALSYAIPIVGGLQAFLNALAETEKEMVSVERLIQIQDQANASADSDSILATSPCSRLKTGYTHPIGRSNQSGISLQATLTHHTMDSPGLPSSAATGRGFAEPARAVVIEMFGAALQHVGAAVPSVRRASLIVRAGDRIGVLGRTGSGKTTTLLALSRAVDVVSGDVRVFGVDVREWNVASLRAAVAWVPQAPVLFEGSLMLNVDPWGELRSAKEVATRDIYREQERRRHVKRALEQCGFAVADDIDGAVSSDGIPSTSTAKYMRTVRLDEKVDGSDGGGWSAGERQLLCLARALLSQAPIVCVDEASASVDEATSERIRVALDAAVASRGATALIISHRPSTLASCTRFVTVADGLLSEVGHEAATALMTAEEHIMSV